MNMLPPEPGNARELPATLHLPQCSSPTSLVAQGGLKASGKMLCCALPGSQAKRVFPLAPSSEVCMPSQHSHFLLGFHGLELLPRVFFIWAFLPSLKSHKLIHCLFACPDTCLFFSAKYFAWVVKQLLPVSPKIRSSHFLNCVWRWEMQPLPASQTACFGGLSKSGPQRIPQLSLPHLGKAWLPVFYSVNKSFPALLCLILFCFGVIMAKCGCGELLVVTIPQTHKGERGYASSSLEPRLSSVTQTNVHYTR